MIIKPTQDNIIIKLPKVDKEQVTKSGIVIANAAKQDMPEKGTVVAIGTGRMLANGTVISPEVQVGDEVIFNKFAGTKITSEENELLLIKENDVLAIIK